MTVIAAITLLAWLYLAFLHGRFWQPLLPEAAIAPSCWPSVDIVVPARNEAEALPQSLPSLLAQDYPGAWRVILVDDHSEDGTADVARQLAVRMPERLTVIAAPQLPQGWSGKVAAMHAGLAQSTADYVLFTDADIRHPPQNLHDLVARVQMKKLDLASLMVKLHCRGTAEKFLIPAFVFFFAMLYPFRRANDPSSRLAAAAGGVMLVKRETLLRAGGFAAIKAALIDDCALARLIKSNGGLIELAMTQEVESLRAYPEASDIWRMIARTAFTQLNYSPLLLLGTLLGMALVFAAPVLLFLIAPPYAALMALAAFAIMAGLYFPMIRFYGLPFFWACTLPAAALFYIGATIDSARLYWQGKGGAWKGRDQA